MSSAVAAPITLSEKRQLRREIHGVYFERSSPVATIVKRVRDLRAHKIKWDADPSYRRSMAARGYIRDLLGKRTDAWEPKDAEDVPGKVLELDESTQRFLLIASAIGDTRGVDPEWAEVSAVAEAIHLYPHSINTLTTENVTSLHADATVDELQRFIQAASATTTSAKDPAPASGARRPTRQGAGGVLSKEVVTKALLGFATFIAKFATVEAFGYHKDHNINNRALAMQGSVEPCAPRIPAWFVAALISFLIGAVTLAYFLGTRKGQGGRSR